jgi:alpha-L-rhamnosidase
MTEVSRRAVLGGVAGTVALTAVPVGARAVQADTGGSIRPVRLTTEHLVDPLGIDVAAPRFGWQLHAKGTDRAQSAYQILVATTPARLTQGRPDVWDSGRVTSSQQSAQVYGGPALRSRTRYYWAVRVWDESRRPGRMSDVAWFETAMLSERDWTADWVGSGVVLPPPTRVLAPQGLEETRLTAERTLGQSFLSRSRLAAVAVLLAGPATESAGCVMTLRRDGPDGPVIGRRTLTGLTGESQGKLDLPEPADSGRFFVELSSPQGHVGWMGVSGNEYPDGSAYVGDVSVPGDRWVYGIAPDPPANPLLRTEFQLPAAVVSARLYLAGLGHAVAWVNGRRVGTAELSPACTDYDKRTLYTTHDITPLLREGGNAIGVALGRGFFATRAADSDGSNLAPWVAEPQVKAQLEVTLAGGRQVTVGTDADWRIIEGPTTYDGVYTGESYDARRAEELRGWTSPGFDAHGWRQVAVVKPPADRLQAYAVEPVQADETVKPVRVSRPADGVRLYDFGVVLAGWARLRGRLPAGTTVRLLYSEKLGSDGRIEVGAPGGNHNPSVGGRFQVDEFTAAGRGEETWQPSFTYKGFRYVEVTGTTRPLDLVAVPVQSDLSSTMKIRLSHPVLQWIADAFRQTARNGLHGQPDISPMYTKLGWTGPTHLAGQPMLYQFGMAAVFGKWLEDIRLGQADSGEIPIIAPLGAVWDGALLSPSFTGVYPSLVRRYWLTYGDPTVPERHFDAVRRYVEWVLTRLRDDIADDRFGDWYPPRPTGYPRGREGGRLVGTAYVIQTLRDATALAELLGHDKQARTWRNRTDRIIRRFNKEFLDTGARHYRTDVDTEYRQASNALPLAFGLVPAEYIDAVAANLAADVEEKAGHLDTGSVGTSALPYALSDHGRADLALAVLQQRDYPSYGYLRDLGATTLWESWEATSRGHNDTTLSSPVRWLVERVLGVEPLEPGWARFRIAPRAFGDLPSAGVTLDTVRGRIDVAWRRRGDDLVLDARVPVNAVAELTLPNGTRRELGSGTHNLVTSLE